MLTKDTIHDGLIGKRIIYRLESPDPKDKKYGRIVSYDDDYVYCSFSESSKKQVKCEYDEVCVDLAQDDGIHSSSETVMNGQPPEQTVGSINSISNNDESSVQKRVDYMFQNIKKTKRKKSNKKENTTKKKVAKKKKVRNTTPSINKASAKPRKSHVRMIMPERR